MERKLQWYLLVQLFLLLLGVFFTSFCFVTQRFILSGLGLLLSLFFIRYIYQDQLKIYKGITQFTEGIRYRDFSRRSSLNHQSPALKALQDGFNQINEVFKAVSKDKETHYHYLHQVLEMVDTGILSYENVTGEVIWMNESSKQLLQIPYLKVIHALEKRSPELYQQIITLKPGESKIGKVQSDKVPTKILLSASSFFTDGKLYQLVAFQNINEALDETEARAWQKLLSVLTHEIMNSIAPISSLAATMKNSLSQLDRSQMDNSFIEDLELGIGTIKSRSEGLLKFAETYRNLNRITQPERRKLYVRDLLKISSL